MSVAAKILVIDNYDSFVFNLVQYFGELGATIDIARNDQITLNQITSRGYQGIVISPGPGRPNNAGICIDIIRDLSANYPILGVCLGHQAIGEAFGGAVVRAPLPMHGKTSMISHTGTGLFDQIETPFQATRYHSLILDESSLPKELEITARSEDGLIMGISHNILPTYGVQFHPESIYTTSGRKIVANFMNICSQLLVN